MGHPQWKVELRRDKERKRARKAAETPLQRQQRLQADHVRRYQQ